MNITIKNSDGTFDITQLVTTVSISGDYQQCSRTLDFSMVSSPIDNSIPSIRCELGNAVTLTENNEIMFQGKKAPMEIPFMLLALTGDFT